jgi:glucose/arabinose dehydrogenase
MTVILIIILLSSFTLSTLLVHTAHAQPYVRDTTLNVEPVVQGLSSPTSMAFLDDNNLLVLEKEGNVRLVSNGVLQQEPVLQVPANSLSLERGLVGIAIVNNSGGAGVNNDVVDVLLYFTEADPLRNKVYKYQWNGRSLINPTLILDLPAEPGPEHNGGKMVIGPDGYLYVIIGTVNRNGQLQNLPGGSPPDDTGVIFRVNPEDGSAAPGNPFGNSGNKSLSKYYAYGIRNSFGMDFDPLTNNLWDTENGDSSFDEINLVRPGFNSGWARVQGPSSLFYESRGEMENYYLVNFPGSNYSDPVLSWRESVGPTDLEFFNSSKLGDNYTNNIFVGDYGYGNLYFFEVNQNRDGINFNSSQEFGLSDHIVDSAIINGTSYISAKELSAITFGGDFGPITEIETGPDGFLYVLSFGYGTVYKISPSVSEVEKSDVAHTRLPGPTVRTDEPFTNDFLIAGVDNDTGYIVNWVTANNVTGAVGVNASEMDLTESSNSAKDGFIQTGITLPNGTIHIGEKYRACTMVPKYMYQDCSIAFNSPIRTPESTRVMIPSLNGTTNPGHAQRTQTIEESPFLTVFRVAGVDNDTGYIANWVTANNVTNVLVYNASRVDSQDNRVDGFIDFGIGLPNGTMHIGDKYKACIMVLKDNNLICNEGFNWPDARPEYNYVTLP